MIAQRATAPYDMSCTTCGRTWTPPNARGKDHPTASSLDREALAHWQECDARAQLREGNG